MWIEPITRFIAAARVTAPSRLRRRVVASVTSVVASWVRSPPLTRSPQASHDPSTRLLREKSKRVSRHLPKALAGDAEEIHQMRVAARRLRVALPLLARKPRGKRAREALQILRDLARTAGLSRDLDVGLAMFDARLAELGTRTPELQSLRRALVSARNRSRQSMAEGLLDLEIARLRRHLVALQKRGGVPVFTVLVRLREAAQEEYDAILGDLDALGIRFDAEALHGVRSRCRRLRYTAEILDALRAQQSGAPRLLRDLQEGLGRLHDAHVLAAWLQHAGQRARARGRMELAIAARRERNRFLEDCRGLHGAFLGSNPRRTLDQVLTAMIPSRAAAQA
jgi:CHAD domain-containing protein